MIKTIIMLSVFYIVQLSFVFFILSYEYNELDKYRFFKTKKQFLLNLIPFFYFGFAAKDFYHFLKNGIRSFKQLS